MLPFVTNAQIGDSTNAEFLRSLGIGNFDVCFVTISGSFQNSLEITSLLKELGAGGVDREKRWVSIKLCKSAFGFERVFHTDRKEIHGEKTTKHSR